MISKLIAWLKKKDNYIYIIMLTLGVIIATYKYDLLSAIIGFSIIILFGIFLGFIFRRFMK